MRTYERYLFGSESANSRRADVGRALLRVFAGLALALAHGLGKLPPSEGFVDAVGNLGFPAPVLFAWLSAFAEFVGGLLLSAGLLTRPAALFIVVNMAVAAALQHADDPFATREKALLFASISLMYMLAGAGRYSLDAVIRRKRS